MERRHYRLASHLLEEQCVHPDFQGQAHGARAIRQAAFPYQAHRLAANRQLAIRYPIAIRYWAPFH
jgi:hypothetical protein